MIAWFSASTFVNNILLIFSWKQIIRGKRSIVAAARVGVTPVGVAVMVDRLQSANMII